MSITQGYWVQPVTRQLPGSYQAVTRQLQQGYLICCQTGCLFSCQDISLRIREG